MSLSELNRLAVLWRRKWLVLGTVVVVVAATQLVSRSLTPIYAATSTLFVAQPGASTFEAVQANEEVARSFAQILSSPNFARQVANRVGGVSESIVSSETTIQSVANTELLTISVEDPSPTRAYGIAQAYAAVFVAFAPRLTPQANTTVAVAADNATIPTSPIRPKPTLYSLAAAILGVMVGIALAFLRERFDVRLRSAAEVADYAEFPVLATIPIRTSESRSLSGFAEAFRLLRTNMQFVDQLGHVRSIAITSWTEGEGKTLIASQLALTLAASGTSTVIVDGDAHRPRLQSLMKPELTEALQPGLSDFLLGSATAEQIVYETNTAGLGLVPPGRPVPSFSSLLQSRGGQPVFKALGEHSGALIVDCPPLVAGADAPTAAGHVDAVILVVDLRIATTTALDRMTRQLEAVGATIIGIVVNRDPEPVARSYDGYRHQLHDAPPWGRALLAGARRAVARNR